MEDDVVLNANYTYSNGIHHYGNVSADTPVYNRLDLNLSKKIAGGRGEVMVGVSDVLNEVSGPVGGVGEFAGHELPGRTFFARLQMKF